MKRILWIFMIVCCMPMIVMAQVPNTVTVTTPVSGSIVMGLENRLVRINTATGAVEVLLEQDARFSFRHVIQKSDGQAIAYTYSLDTYILEQGQFTQIAKSEYPNFIFAPMGWLGNSLLGYQEFDTHITKLQIYDTQNQTVRELRNYVVADPLPETPNYTFSQVITASQNPMFTDWIAYRLSATPIDYPETEQLPTEGIVIVSNIATGDTYVLNDLIEAPVDGLATWAWSPDGRYIAVDYNYGGDEFSIYQVLDSNGIWDFQLIDQTIDLNGDYSPLGWLGIGDLLIFYKLGDRDRFYVLGQLLEGKVYAKEWFQFNLDDFSVTSLGNISRGNFVLTADETEKSRLSCLFADEYVLPTQLAIGMRASVALGGTANRVRDNHRLSANLITEIAPGTEFTVLGEAYCQDGYRWWQIQLDNGTTGWTVEGNAQEYFIEPVPSITLNGTPIQATTKTP